MTSSNPADAERLAEIEARLTSEGDDAYDDWQADEDVHYLLDRVKAAEARIQEQEAEIQRLRAARPICSCVPQDPDCPARAPSSATDGEQP